MTTLSTREARLRPTSMQKRIENREQGIRNREPVNLRAFRSPVSYSLFSVPCFPFHLRPELDSRATSFETQAPNNLSD